MNVYNTFDLVNYTINDPINFFQLNLGQETYDTRKK